MDNTNYKEDICKKIKALQNGEEIIITINGDIMRAMEWIRFKENNLNTTLQALQENKYGFYDKSHIMKVYSDLEDLRLERNDIIYSVGESLLGENWRQLLNETGCEFRIDDSLPVVVIFKLCRD